VTRVASFGSVGLASVGLLVCAIARADAPFPPWFDEGAIPAPSWARSVAPRADERGKPGDMVLFEAPARTSARRGLTVPGTSLWFFGAQRGSGCTGPWWLVGPLAWACSDQAELSPADPVGSTRQPSPLDGLPASYFFVNPDGASAYASLETVEEGTPDRELEGGWGVAAVEERAVQGAPWVRTSKGLWVATRDLAPARPSTFHGVEIAGGKLDFAWVRADRASVWPTPSSREKPTGSHPRFTLVRLDEESGALVRVDGAGWMLRQDLARPTLAPPPPEVAVRSERWIDVDLGSQTLVAYEGAVPVYATLVSTGRVGEDATPPGVHRIWVKIVASDMGNSARSDVEAHYSLEDVPYVQFFDGAVALHGTYWHRDFGHARSHGCVNLAPIDARWMFTFTSPEVPSGWAAAYPYAYGEGSIVRVR
jgi:hypothetical protein